MEDERIPRVRKLIRDYVSSPSLKHIRDPYALDRLAIDIVAAFEPVDPIWRKWSDRRETVLKSALTCWIPFEDLREFLNLLPGPKLTLTDVKARFAVFEEQQGEWNHDHLKDFCERIYEKERAQGTELPAIIAYLRARIAEEEQRDYDERQIKYQQLRDQQRAERVQRLKFGADIGWTQMAAGQPFFCRKNGRTFRLTLGKDKRWELHSVNNLEDPGGYWIGRYQGRADATKAVNKAAFSPVPFGQR